MANTFQIIASNTLTTSTASLSFSSIPQTYTDLVLKISARTDESGTVYSGIGIIVNDDVTSAYSYTRVVGNGSAVTEAEATGNGYAYINFAANGASALANSFCNTEIYIPRYTLGTMGKPFGVQATIPNNASGGYAGTQAHLFSVSGAITKITITYAGTPSNFVANSSFTLYGIKNS